MDDAYDTIEKLQNMLTQGKVVRVPIIDKREKLKEERRKRNIVVLRCLSRIRRNKLFAYAFRKWYMVVSTQQQQQQQGSGGRQSDKDESLKWKQKYEETNKKLDKLQKKFDEVMPILIAAAERAAVAASTSPQRKIQEEDPSFKEEKEKNRVKEAKEETMKKLNAAVNSKSCVVM